MRGCLLALALFAAAPPSCTRPAAAEEQLALVDEYPTFLALSASPLMRLSKKEAWRRSVPGIAWVEIPSTADGSMQPALFYDSGSSRKKPLLVVLHSWSADFEQHSSIPYGLWAARNDWVLVHPDYRGAFDGADATGSELAVQDVVDAVAFARARANVDPERVYLTGFSGGGMMSLLMAGRHPELWTAVVSWVPVLDLVTWYGEVRRRHRDYAREIRRSCGGAPLPGTAAHRSCLQRSPISYLEAAREGGAPIYIATGIDDPFVSPAHALEAFNALATPEDRVPADQVRAIADSGKVPDALAAASSEPLYDAARRPLLIVRRSKRVELRVFKGRHDVVYNADLTWLSGQRRDPGR